MKRTLQSLSLFAIFALAASLSFAQDGKEIRKTLPLNRDGEIKIDTFKGSVTVTTWDGQQVDIQARVEPGGQSAEERKMVQDTDVNIEASADSIRIRSNYDRVQQHSNFSWDSDDSSHSLPLIHYTIKVPRTAKLTITDHKSKINVSDLQADLRINTHKGSVAVVRQNGAVNLDTHKGDARVEFLSLSKASHFDTHKGDIEIVIPGRAGFDLESEMGKGATLDSAYDLSGLRHEQDKREARYRGSVNGGGALLRLNSHKGQIRLKQS